ncbi:neural-cadherin-like [Anthonomus grandis grandis]|uniref:neural-cadherin-like n=1 Tax=Anthonomus grandis grandis TaxID=2921223 RepID=UPI002165E689|nr:neural-cadherin-like [Anthonomus grandis grandis]
MLCDLLLELIWVMVDPFKVFWVLTNSTYIVTKFIRIGIADKNDSPPYFEKAFYEAEVDENEDLQHTILTVTAKSHYDSSRLRYEITGGNVGGVFAVKNTTGDIYLAGPLDYETRNMYELKLSAFEKSKENSTVVVIKVRDVNDNPPVFERSTFRTQITEEDGRNLPKSILNVTATDGDIERPQNIVYFLTGQGIDPDNPANSKFKINKTTGEISVLKPLDRDLPNGRPQWRFTVFAQDEGGEGLVGYADVQVNLKDINDNAPVFPHGVYYGNVTENTTVGAYVMTMNAIDYDDPLEGGNSRLVYSIEKNVIEEETGSAIFEIEPDTGVIRTSVCCLDRERTPDYSIQVVAIDGGGLKGTGTASVRVKDINDMPPSFTKPEWFAEVDETYGEILPEMPILTVTVHDEDETNEFQYEVVENSGYGAEKFAMVRNNDGTGSLKVVQPLDFEDYLQSKGFRFRIQVIDRGDNNNDKYHVAYSWVIVKLRDVNDNEPIFEKPNIKVSILENAEVGKSLERFKATDPDQNGKSKVSYLIDRKSDRERQFAINQEGIVSIQRPLDREKMEQHVIKILAIDDGNLARTATATLTVIVEDVNDNAPRLLKDYKPVIVEHAKIKKVVEIFATDDDDPKKHNGPPFQFKIDPSASKFVKDSFRIEQGQKSTNKDDMAIITTLRQFDREDQKEYHIPIAIKDSGNPAMTGTSTITVIIGDINDHKMQPGSKNIFVYNYEGQSPETEIGRVYVYDLDDWDLPDKKFYWENNLEHPRFKLQEDTGMISIRHGTKYGVYNLKFKVYDRKHGQADISANVTVTVKEILYKAVINSGSIRISGITDEEFIREWNYKLLKSSRSIMDRLTDKIAELLNINRKNVDIFSVQLQRRQDPPVTDVRFSAQEDGLYFKPVKLNGIILMHRDEIQKAIGINITMVGIDECLYENQVCDGSCTNTLDISALPYMVNANKTALVGIRVDNKAECTCGGRNFTKEENCRNTPCYNGGLCSDLKSSLSCSCSSAYTGQRCQQTTRSFRGNGWAWYPPLDMCDKSHLHFEFITKTSDGLLLYNGPIVPPKEDEIIVSDYIAVELERGYPRLLIDFGSGTLELRVKTKTSLDDGEWHRLDIFWDTENVRMVVDFCKSADIAESEDGTISEFNDSICQAQGTVPPFSEYLNLNTPLQLGGLYVDQFDPTYYHWKYMPAGKSFDGCIKNFFLNSQLYDLAHPGLSKNSMAGCPQTDKICQSSDTTARCFAHGSCFGSMNEAKCHCHPGFTGPSCTSPTTPVTFQAQSYVKYALSFEPDRFSTQIQLRFRTREPQGELFRVSDQHNREYAILEIKHSRLCFRYNLNSHRNIEKTIWLNEVLVDDGQWHIAKVSRYGSAAILELDGGEGRRLNETFNFSGHQWLFVDKQEGVYSGGKAEYTGIRTFEVYADYQNGCIDDIRLDGKQLPLPPAMNGTQWGQATVARNLDRGCFSSIQCKNVHCPQPFECVDLWNDFDCTCGEGRVISADSTDCIDKDECLDLPCLNGGTCINLEPIFKYRCNCPAEYWGENCEILLEGQILKLSIGAFAAILVCLCIMFFFLIIFVIYNLKKDTHTKDQGSAEDDVRENIINYDDEGGGEDDMTAFDIKPLQIPINGNHPDLGLSQHTDGQERNIAAYLEHCKKNSDADPNAPPFDDLRNYAYEGGGSIAGSLSSLASGTEEEHQDYGYLNSWGPRFDKLACLYTSDVVE